jgi:phage terminase large subunit GpA-like protein
MSDAEREAIEDAIRAYYLSKMSAYELAHFGRIAKQGDGG